MLYTLLIYESPDDFAGRSETEANEYVSAWRSYYASLVASGSYSCTLTASDCAEGYQFKPSVCACVSSSPILFDTAGDGYGLTNAADGVAEAAASAGAAGGLLDSLIPGAGGALTPGAK